MCRGRIARPLIATAVAVGVAVLAACSSGAPHPTAVLGTSAAPAASPMLVALGDEVTSRVNSGEPIHASWPQQFYRAALPRATTFVNLATDIADTDAAREFETPLLHDLHPTVVVALLGLGDVEQGVAPAAFGRDLAGVLHDVQGAGAQRILVATLPDDVYPTDYARTVIPQYNAQIRSAVADAHATLVDLVPLTVSGQLRIQVPDLSVYVIDDDGERTIADAFTRAYRAAFPKG